MGLLTLGFDPARSPAEPPACYRASWQLPGPDSHRQATTSLSLDSAGITSNWLGARNIEASLSQIAIGVAELRNQYGPDHGRAEMVTGLTSRHAHLAVGSASTYCRLLLETLEDPAAPWRRDTIRDGESS